MCNQTEDLLAFMEARERMDKEESDEGQRIRQLAPRHP